MSILNKLTLESLKLNKKRTIGTIIGITLSVALICTVSNMVASFKETLVQNAINESGYYHLKLRQVNNHDLNKLLLNKDIKKVNSISKLGYSYLDLKNTDFPYIEISSLKKEDFNDLSYQIIEGRLPENNQELVVSNKIKINSNLKIGDTITFKIGERKTSDDFILDSNNLYLDENEETIDIKMTKTYKIVGIVNKENVDSLYYGLTTGEDKELRDAYISLKNPRDYESSFMEILGADTYLDVEMHNIKNCKYQYELNNELLRWEVFKISDTTMDMIIAVAGVVIFIIIFTSVFCIRNSFAISTMEKMRMYGMLSSVGATKKQIKKSVLCEGLILGIIAIPLGILCGIIAVVILIKIVNILLGDFLFNNIDGLVFEVSLTSILISTFLGLITIYFSSISAAKKASKVSPIDNLKNTSGIKISAKKLRTPKIIKKVFKTGGSIAYKNLKRSKKKYRTTVISLTVSIFVFISIFAFIEEGFKQAGNYYTNYDYNLKIDLNKNYSEEQINELRNLNNIENSYLLYQAISNIQITDLSKISSDSIESLDCDDECTHKYLTLNILLLDDDSFTSYVKKINGKYDDLKTKGILVDEYYSYQKKEGDKREREYVSRFYTYKEGEVINSTLTNEEQIRIEVGKVTNIRPYGMENTYYYGGYIILNEKYFSNLKYEPYQLLINSNNNEQLIKDIKALNGNINYYDMEKEAASERSMVIVISIFLYGFIGVITLIGVTNIFNTITSNMKLRQKEFAMLKSIGMTHNEFNHMINLETLFYSTKSLLYGIILGITGAYFIHQAFGTNVDAEFTLPYKAIVISIIFVFIIVYIIMKYSINKINKQNTIETIRKENI